MFPCRLSLFSINTGTIFENLAWVKYNQDYGGDIWVLWITQLMELFYFTFMHFLLLVSETEESLKTERFFDIQRLLQLWKIFTFQRQLPRVWRKLGQIPVTIGRPINMSLKNNSLYFKLVEWSESKCTDFVFVRKSMRSSAKFSATVACI